MDYCTYFIFENFLRIPPSLAVVQSLFLIDLRLSHMAFVLAQWRVTEWCKSFTLQLTLIFVVITTVLVSMAYSLCSRHVRKTLIRSFWLGRL
jgi:hypothetical protein